MVTLIFLKVARLHWLRGNKTVVLGVRADPKPMNPVAAWYAERPEMQTDSGAVELATAKLLEVQGRMTCVLLEEFEIFVCKNTNLFRQSVIAAPKPCRRRVIHSCRWLLDLKSSVASVITLDNLPEERSASI